MFPEGLPLPSPSPHLTRCWPIGPAGIKWLPTLRTPSQAVSPPRGTGRSAGTQHAGTVPTEDSAQSSPQPPVPDLGVGHAWLFQLLPEAPQPAAESGKHHRGPQITRRAIYAPSRPECPKSEGVLHRAPCNFPKRGCPAGTEQIGLLIHHPLHPEPRPEPSGGFRTEVCENSGLPRAGGCPAQYPGFPKQRSLHDLASL